MNTKSKILPLAPTISSSVIVTRLRTAQNRINTRSKPLSAGFVGMLAAALLTLLTPWSALASESVIAPTMVGHWTGNAHIIVNWCQQTNLPIALDIRADGGVAGKVGDATLTKGRLEHNRGWLGRKLNLKTDYIITGSLAGPIISAESLTRSGVKMPLNFRGGTFVGGLHTSGLKLAGKERAILSAGLTLIRTNSP